jgi:hypothetical protein
MKKGIVVLKKGVAKKAVLATTCCRIGAANVKL